MHAPTVNPWIRARLHDRERHRWWCIIAIAPPANSNVSSAAEEFEKLPIVAALLSSTGPFAVVGLSQRSRRENRYKSAPLALCGACTHMHALTLRAEEAEEFDGRCAGSPEPVRDAGVELGRLTRSQQKVVLAENNPQLAAQDV